LLFTLSAFTDQLVDVWRPDAWDWAVDLSGDLEDPRGAESGV